MRKKDTRFSSGFAATGAECMAVLILSQFGQGDMGRSKCCPCTKQDYGPMRAARSCPAGVTAPPGTDVLRRRVGRGPLCLKEGREGFPRDPELQSTLLGFAEERHLVTAETTQ